MSFAGRTALVTGAASGIGAAVAQWLDARGIAELVLVDIDAQGLDALSLGCQQRRFAGDVADPLLWDRIEAEVPRLDHALVNAGIANGIPLTETELRGVAADPLGQPRRRVPVAAHRAQDHAAQRR